MEQKIDFCLWGFLYWRIALFRVDTVLWEVAWSEWMCTMMTFMPFFVHCPSCWSRWRYWIKWSRFNPLFLLHHTLPCILLCTVKPLLQFLQEWTQFCRIMISYVRMWNDTRFSSSMLQISYAEHAQKGETDYLILECHTRWWACILPDSSGLDSSYMQSKDNCQNLLFSSPSWTIFAIPTHRVYGLCDRRSKFFLFPDNAVPYLRILCMHILQLEMIHLMKFFLPPHDKCSSEQWMHPLMTSQEHLNWDQVHRRPFYAGIPCPEDLMMMRNLFCYTLAELEFSVYTLLSAFSLSLSYWGTLVDMRLTFTNV